MKKTLLVALALIAVAPVAVEAQTGLSVTSFPSHLTTHSNEARSETITIQNRGDLLALRRQTKIAGIALASVWGTTVVVAAAVDDSAILATMLPVVGPFLAISAIQGDPQMDFITGGKEALIFAGLAQAGLAIWFLTSYRKQKAFTSGISVSPVFHPNGTGIAVGYRF